MAVADDSSRRVTPQVVVAAAVILFGLILTADNLGLVDAASLLCYWPIVLVALGYTIYARAADRPGRIAGGFLMVVGGSMTIGRAIGADVSLLSLWPLVLVAIGITIIVRARGGTAVATDQRVSDVAFWSGVQRRVTAPNFRRADLTAVMGGIEIDFRPAATARGEAIVDLFVLMGGVEIRVPPDWAVSNQIFAIMGGVEDRSTGTEASTNRLILRGFVMMGGVEIKT
jgi:predicted membrane protein